LIERWAEVVHRGDLEGVLADHAEDIVSGSPTPCCMRRLTETAEPAVDAGLLHRIADDHR
jgi:hypothetical protein